MVSIFFPCLLFPLTVDILSIDIWAGPFFGKTELWCREKTEEMCSNIFVLYRRCWKKSGINGFKLMRFQLDIWETFLTVKWQIELLRKAVRFPSIEVLRTGWANLYQDWCSFNWSCPEESIKFVWIMVSTHRSYTDTTMVWCKRHIAEGSRSLSRGAAFLYLSFSSLLSCFSPSKAWESSAVPASMESERKDVLCTVGKIFWCVTGR